jgi:hypothetical protein
VSHEHQIKLLKKKKKKKKIGETVIYKNERPKSNYPLLCAFSFFPALEAIIADTFASIFVRP